MPFNRFAPLNMSLRTKTASSPDLRPCQRAYLGASNARRLLKRSALSKKGRRDAPNPEENESITSLHESAALEAATLEAATLAAIAPPPPPPRPAPPTGYSVHCYAAHAEDEARERNAALTETEKRVLLHSINSSRAAEGQPPVRLHALLSKYAQDYADMIAHDARRHAAAVGAGGVDLPILRAGNANINSVVVVMAPSGARVARLVSPARMGALACGEMWYGGKYRRHLYNVESVIAHPDDCPCHLRIVFETMVDEGWKAIGIGRGEDGRWVVELGQ